MSAVMTDVFLWMAVLHSRPRTRGVMAMLMDEMEVPKDENRHRNWDVLLLHRQWIGTGHPLRVPLLLGLHHDFLGQGRRGEPA